jgi:predicted esterase
MSDVKALENAVKALPPHDLAEFRRWFAEFDLAAWDERIEDDLASGKLDELLAEAEEDYASGERRPL